MGSKSPGTQTTTASSAPWAGQQPYLQAIMGEGQRLYDEGPSQYFNGSTVVPYSPYTTGGMSQLYQQASQPAWGGDAARGGLFSTLTGGQHKRLDVLEGMASGSNPFMQQIQAAADRATGMGVDRIDQAGASATPYVQDMIGQGLRSNNAGMRELAAGAGQNAGIEGIRSAAGREITSGQHVLNQVAAGDLMGANPYMDRMYDRAASRVRDNTNAAFSQAGRYGSAAHSGTLSDSLSDMAAQMYGGAYESERGRQMSAVSELGARQAQDINRSLSGASQIAGLNESRFGRMSQFGQELGQRQLGDINRAMGAYGTAAGYGSSDLARLMSSGQALAGIDMSDAGRRISTLGQLAGMQGDAANASNAYGLQQSAQAMQAMGMLPMLRGYEQMPTQDLFRLGAMQEGKDGEYLQDQINRHNFNQQAKWDNLGRYSAAVGGLGNLGGTTTTIGPQQRSNSFMGALGGASAGAGIASALGATTPVGWGLAGLGALTGLL